MELILFLAALGFFLIGAFLIVYWFEGGRASQRRQTEAGAPRPRRADRGTIEMPCSVCQRQLIFSPNELVALSKTEVALVVRSRHDAVKHRLAEYVCPYCEAAHCFMADLDPPTWIGANFYEPQVKSGKCAECGTPLRTPPWPKGTYQGDVAAAPQFLADYGLECGQCHSVCCVACCQRHTKVRADDRYLEHMNEHFLCCPRCSRRSMDRFFFP